jgi:hypothetical protein
MPSVGAAIRILCMSHPTGNGEWVTRRIQTIKRERDIENNNRARQQLDGQTHTEKVWSKDCREHLRPSGTCHYIGSAFPELSSPRKFARRYSGDSRYVLSS